MTTHDQPDLADHRAPMLVGVDWTDGSQRALDWTAAVARRLGTGVELVHANSPWVGLELAVPPFDYDAYRSAVASLVDGWASKLDGIDHHSTVIEDEAAHAVLAVASEIHPSLIVLGSHGGGRWAPHVLGSVTSKVLHWTDRPVAVIPRSESDGFDGGRIVVGVDGSAPSLRALRWAADWAAALQVGVYALCVFPFSPYREKPRLADSESPRPEADTLSALRVLAAQVAQESGADIASDVLIGHPVTRLVEAARDQSALAVGSTGHSTFHSIVVGSTSRMCATHSKVPTVVVP